MDCWSIEREEGVSNETEKRENFEDHSDCWNRSGVSGGIWGFHEKREGDETYTNAEELAGLTQKPEMASDEEPVDEKREEDLYIDPIALSLEGIDLAALREVNDNVVGWIIIPETELSYPIVQGEDNEYYLNHTWEKEWNSVGSIFLECMVSFDFSDINTIIYGHRMRNESMFGTLKLYAELSYWESRPSIYIVNDSGVHRYDIFAAHEADAEAITFGLGISSRPKKQEFIDFNLEQSVIETGIKPITLDRIITLSTCTGRGYSTRWAMQAVLRDGVPPPGVP